MVETVSDEDDRKSCGKPRTPCSIVGNVTSPHKSFLETYRSDREKETKRSREREAAADALAAASELRRAFGKVVDRRRQRPTWL